MLKRLRNWKRGNQSSKSPSSRQSIATERRAREPLVSRPTPSPLPDPEPDYAHVQPLAQVPPEAEFDLANLLLIGLGDFGEEVLNRFASFLARYGARGQDSPQLLVLSINEDNPRRERRKVTSKDDNGNWLKNDEKLALNLERFSQVNFDWYHPGKRGEIGRPEGRLLLFQDLMRSSPALWREIENKVAEAGSVPDVWIIGSSAELISTGLVFDLSHLVRLITKRFNKDVFIGWMFAAPHQSWEGKRIPETIAFLREWERLQYGGKRHYQFYADADNPALNTHTDEGRRDNDLLFLVQPPEDMRRGADIYLQELMATALLSLSQSVSWQAFKEAVRVQKNRQQNIGLLASFATLADFIPLHELQHSVRSQLSYDLIFGKIFGLFPRGVLAYEEPDEIEAVKLLRRIGYPLFSAIADEKKLRRSFANEQLNVMLMRHLRMSLQQLLDSAEQPALGLKRCAALLEGVKSKIELAQGRIDEDIWQSLFQVVEEAQSSLADWQRWRRGGEKFFDSYMKAPLDASKKQRRESQIWQSLSKNNSTEAIYRSLTKGSEDIRNRIRPYVRWAWVVERGRLQLTLDTLIPEWSGHRKAAWRHHPGTSETDLQRLWNDVMQIVTSFTSHPAYWQLSDTDYIDELFQGERYKLELDFSHAVRGGQVDTVYWISGNEDWLQKAASAYKLQADEKQFRIGPSTLLLGFRYRFPLALQDIQLYKNGISRYLRSPEPKRIHIFPPEQRALALEKVALWRYRPRDDVSFLPLLPHEALVWFESEDGMNRVRGFVGAWLAGLLQYDVAQKSWLFLRPNSTGASSVLHTLNTQSGEPYLALVDFMKQAQAFSEEEVWLEWGQQYLQSADDSPLLDEVLDWGNDPKSAYQLYWYILVEGLRDEASQDF